jgi:hypothetical protein
MAKKSKSSRIVEWGILAAVVVVLITVFGRQMQVVQGQAERGAILSTLGTLRTAFVIAHLRANSTTNTTPVASQQRNPFLLLERVPANYVGELGIQKIIAAPPGSWAFDPDCGCIGYLPLYPQWLQSPPDAQAIWFRISPGPGALSISVLNNYVWQGQALD